MISALVRIGAAEGGVEALAVTLSALVSAVADGLVGDAVVLAATPDGEAERVADALGAAFVVCGPGEAWRGGARLAKRDWVICLDAGDVPAMGWIRAVERFVALSPPERRFGRLPRRSSGIADAIGVRWRGLARQVGPGDVVRRDLLLEGARPGRPARIASQIERDPVFG